MYLASFAIDQDQILQGCVHFPSWLPANDSANDHWWREFERLLFRLDSVEEVTASLRVLSGGDKPLERTLIISAPDRREAALRRYLASFIRLDNILEGSVVLPLTREEHDTLMDGFPRSYCRIATPSHVGEVWFACNFRVAPLLSDLLVEADTLGYHFGYQVHIRRLTIDLGWIREVRKNALRVRNLNGVPEEVALMQQRLAECLMNSTAICEEFLAADMPEACDWLSEILRRHFRRQFSPLKFDVPEFKFIDDDYGEILNAALHSSMFSERPLDEICCSAIADNDSVKLLGWHPSTDLSKQLASRMPSPKITQYRVPETEGSRPALLTQALPTPYEGDESFIFISYGHQDVGCITPILHHLIQRGYNVWYDRGIPGGTEWDAFIEQKLTDCFLVLLFVSQSSIKSKYVRREAKFADTLNKPIISVKLEEANLIYGMNMLLSQYQMISSTASDFDAQLQKAIRYVLTSMTT